jgi:hypothetical protein
LVGGAGIVVLHEIEQLEIEAVEHSATVPKIGKSGMPFARAAQSWR